MHLLKLHLGNKCMIAEGYFSSPCSLEVTCDISRLVSFQWRNSISTPQMNWELNCVYLANSCCVIKQVDEMTFKVKHCQILLWSRSAFNRRPWIFLGKDFHRNAAIPLKEQLLILAVTYTLCGRQHRFCAKMPHHRVTQTHLEIWPKKKTTPWKIKSHGTTTTRQET